MTNAGLQAIASELAQNLNHNLKAQVAVAIWPNEDDGPPAAALFGNLTSHAMLVKRLCEVTLMAPRPDDCDVCARSWDRVQAAMLALADVSDTPCN